MVIKSIFINNPVTPVSETLSHLHLFSLVCCVLGCVLVCCVLCAVCWCASIQLTSLYFYVFPQDDNFRPPRQEEGLIKWQQLTLLAFSTVFNNLTILLTF